MGDGSGESVREATDNNDNEPVQKKVRSILCVAFAWSGSGDFFVVDRHKLARIDAHAQSISPGDYRQIEANKRDNGTMSVLQCIVSPSPILKMGVREPLEKQYIYYVMNCLGCMRSVTLDRDDI